LINRLSITDGSLSKGAIAAIRTYVITRANEDKALEFGRKIARR
jgi:alcohol dehydrogenase (cytochrome c)/quinohemoprotein ethanol dehydrogenase